jgi:hypothetical protein
MLSRGRLYRGETIAERCWIETWSVGDQDVLWEGQWGGGHKCSPEFCVSVARLHVKQYTCCIKRISLADLIG